MEATSPHRNEMFGVGHAVGKDQQCHETDRKFVLFGRLFRVLGR